MLVSHTANSRPRDQHTTWERVVLCPPEHRVSLGNTLQTFHLRFLAAVSVTEHSYPCSIATAISSSADNIISIIIYIAHFLSFSIPKCFMDLYLNSEDCPSHQPELRPWTRNSCLWRAFKSSRLCFPILKVSTAERQVGVHR